MTDSDPDPNNPLSPYYPSEAPGIPGSGRKWFALLLALMILLGASFGVLSLLFSL
ncbi:hypothetical protein HUG10_02995 [Halorarum halophilum]|uniref:Uncharacterized protein n=1 Tax=Halorarum halophilum TaxID=2743090 RepID=A0A7D5GJ20_9EURY|nr:hypothetical protein [Halobaculum halophilum]QLG26564.1 hypothetical protein HUG10_02995 [Halobaculum halophilum]